MIKKWVMTRFIEWAPGEKHPATPVKVFKNVHDCDKIRRVLLARCNICNYVVSRDPIAVKELLYKCDNKRCCLISPGLHQVCDVCYWMWRALYANLGLKDQRYFKEGGEL
jgi:hypothetical protein